MKLTRSTPVAQKLLERVIFNVRWMLPMFYIGLVVVLVLYGLAYAKEVVHLVVSSSLPDVSEMKILVLDTVDVVMIANLVKLILTGSYNSFINKNHGYPNENVSSGVLKIKIMTSVVVVSAIYMLRTFVTSTNDWDSIYKQLYLFGAFLSAALILGVIEFIHVKTDMMDDSKHEPT